MMTTSLSKNDIFMMLFEINFLKPEVHQLKDQKIAEQIIKHLNLTYNLDYFLEEWINEIKFNTSRQSKEFIFFHKDIKEAIQVNKKIFLEEPSEIKKRVYLTYYYGYLKADEYLNEISELKVALKENQIIIDKTFITHILYGHFMHKQYASLSNEGASLFYEDIFSSIKKLKRIIYKLDKSEHYNFPSENKVTISFSDSTYNYKIHFEKVSNKNYRFITYYIVDKEQKLESLKTLNHLILGDNEFVYY